MRISLYWGSTDFASFTHWISIFIIGMNSVFYHYLPKYSEYSIWSELATGCRLSIGTMGTPFPKIGENENFKISTFFNITCPKNYLLLDNLKSHGISSYV